MTEDDPTASSDAIVGEPADVVGASEPVNPFTNALVVIYFIAFLVGIVLVSLGAYNAGAYASKDFAESRDNGVALIVWGGAFFSLGITAAMAHIGALAVLWQLKRTAPVPWRT